MARTTTNIQNKKKKKKPIAEAYSHGRRFAEGRGATKHFNKAQPQRTKQNTPTKAHTKETITKRTAAQHDAGVNKQLGEESTNPGPLGVGSCASSRGGFLWRLARSWVV